MEQSNKKVYLCVHGHFYQPPRENPWLEAIELQDSAKPFHDWNERITDECYNPNSISKIIDCENRILDIVNNYDYISYNFGPTLMSWLEVNSPCTYERIIKADIKSTHEREGHGNALAQVYNHIIMPLANEYDKQTQVIWGIRDFEYRFGRKPEGMWLAETAVDDETLRVLAENGIKFTILSPFQADSIRKIGEANWQDVSWGNVDPAKPYRFFVKDSKDRKYIDLFFYDGAISKSVAFDNILNDGNKFISRLKEGIYDARDYNQIINIATDGESYGHHTKFGDMALAYGLRVKAEDEGFTLTNYAHYLANQEVTDEARVKQGSSWSCSHGIGRWKEDCGCSTGGGIGWNQKWRQPLRESLDYLRDRLFVLFKREGEKYFKDPIEARNRYIDIILDRSEDNVETVLKNIMRKHNPSFEDKSNGLKLLEMQRQAMLMYTSCGWFFSEISGIETVQIMKYAARAMQLAADFTTDDFETPFLEILSRAQSNIKEFGNGKDIYISQVKPSIVTLNQIASLWAVKSLEEDFDFDETNLYCYNVNKYAYKKVSKDSTNLVIGRLIVKSKITWEKSDIVFALIQYTGGDFHCAIKEFSDISEYDEIENNLTEVFLKQPLIEIIRKTDQYFGKKYFTIQNIFLEERKKTLSTLLEGKLKKLSEIYADIYTESKGSMYNLQALGLSIPNEFKIAATYHLSKEFNSIIQNCGKYIDKDSIEKASVINEESKKLGIVLDKEITSKIFSTKILQKMFKLAKSPENSRLEGLIELFNFVDKLELQINIAEAQNIYYSKVYHLLGDVISEYENSETKQQDEKFIDLVLELGKRLNISTSFYRDKISSIKV